MTFREKWRSYQLQRFDRVSNARYRCEICKVEITGRGLWCAACVNRKSRT
jgi:hypothetical protein